jgi:hypothetical protein
LCRIFNEYRKSEQTEDLDNNETPPLRIRTDPPSKAEIMQALKEMKNNKAAGIDGIPAEILRFSPQMLCCLFSLTFGHPKPSRTSGKEE